jgi:hypothetical protein
LLLYERHWDKNCNLEEQICAYTVYLQLATGIAATTHLSINIALMIFVITAAGKFVVAVQRNCWRTRYFTKIRKFEKTTRVKFQLMILHF